MDALAQSVADPVDANHILFHQRIVDAFGHISARSPQRSDRFLMARNVAPGLVKAADIIEYAVDTGEAVAPEPPRLYLERCIHGEIFKARADVMSVVHNHSPAVLPFGIVKGARLRPAWRGASGCAGGSRRRCSAACCWSFWRCWRCC